MKKSVLSLAIIALTMNVAQPVLAKDKKEDKKKEQTLAELLEDKVVSEGLFDFYRDKKDGSVLMVLEEAQLDKQFLYFAHTVNGVSDAGHFKGGYRDRKVLSFRRHYDRIDVIVMTPRYVFDENNPISRAADTNISEAVLASLPIKSEEDGKLAVSADKLLLSESLHKVSPWPSSGDSAKDKKRFKVGKFDDKKSRLLRTRGYPDNSDVVVEYVFSNASPKVGGSRAVSDPRAVSVTLQHSFIALPENGFESRRDDARLGYFTQQFDNMTSNDWAPYQDVINRWNLVKKDPQAALSEPVKPITWWIENTTPMEWRDTIREATLDWNSAFEKAGFKNAIEVKVQPDDADWDAGDVHYNVLRWTSSPRPRFGGYGPSLPNPLTGEIIGADVMLEYVFMKNRWLADRLYTSGASHSEMYPEAPQGQPGEQSMLCSAGHEVHLNMLLGNRVLETAGANDLEKSKLLEQGLRMLVLHEVGHTLGLNHNMKASQMFGPKEIHDSKLTQGILSGSVMDYHAINVAPPGVEQGDYFQTKPGPYDDWVIEYGYSQAVEDPQAEEQRLQTILARSTEPELAFGNDADDMRSPGRHIDPRVMIGDLTNDAVTYADDRFKLVDDLFGDLKEKALKEGASHHELVVATNVLMGQMRTMANITSRYIGGVYIDRAVVGQAGAGVPYTPVPLETQQHAMKVLADNLFAADALSQAQPLFAYLQVQRRGFNNFGKNEDPKLHASLLRMQKGVLDHLMHKNVVQRLTDSALYGNEYELNTFMTDLTGSIFGKDEKEINSYRRNLQVEYVNRLIGMSGLNRKSSYDHLSRAAAVYQLQSLRDMKSGWGASLADKAHHQYLRTIIEKAFEQIEA